MAAVLDEKPDPAAKFGSQVDEQIAQATTRIRTHDLALGGLTLAAMTVGYAAGMIALDRYLNLPEWVRRLALGGFLLAAAGVGYLLIVRPLRRRINPLYAAARVEDTIEDAKNSVTGYVEARETGRGGAAKAAMSARAARAVGDADVNQAVDPRRLVLAGGVLVVLLIALAALFFVFRPAQFASLVGRAFVPFSSDPIATRTQLELLRPDPADPTISAGQTVTVEVRVGGKVPQATAPDRVRLLIRHTPTDPVYDELPMQEGETTRHWRLKVPEYLVQNGFWYKVAGGDAETPEYKVSVRSLPMFTDYEVRYEYPAYTRIPPAKGTDANLRAYRGTKVTLTARANRDVADAKLRFEAPGLTPVQGVTPPDRNDAARFRFTATEATRYRLHLTAANGEKNPDPPAFHLALDSDQPPRVEITKPERPEQPTDFDATAPANGQLAVDGTIGDDFGIDKYRLRLRVGDRDLAPVYPGDGKPKSLRRDKDGTWPTDLTASGGFKLSADLPKLAFADGTKFEPKEGDVVEFWVEAIDNCTETKPVEGWGEKPQPGNVGRSDPRRLRLTAPPAEPERQERLDRQKEQRRADEQQHQGQQQQQLENENRPAPQPQDGQKDGGKPDPKNAEGTKGGEKTEGKKDDANGQKDSSDPKGAKGGGDAAGQKDAPPKPPEGTDPKTPDGKKNGTGGADPKAGPDGKGPDTPQPKTGTDPSGMGGMNNTDPQQPAPMPKTPDDRRAEQEAERVRQELDKNKAEGGNAKPSPTTKPEERTDPGQAKPQPKDGGDGAQDSPPKEGPKPADPQANPAGGKDKDPAAANKPQGALEKPTDPAEAKPQPKADGKGADPAESREAPLGGNPGQEKPEPKKGDTPPAPKGGNAPRQDPTSGSTAKPDTAPTEGDPEATPAGGPKDSPADAAGAPKPMKEPARGEDKTPPQQRKAAPPQDPKPKDDGNAGTAKPERAPENATAKPAPQSGTEAGKQPDASETKAPPKDAAGQPGGAAEPKPAKPEPKDGPGAAGGDDKPVPRGEDKPSPKDAGRPQGGAADPQAKKEPGKGEGRKLDPKEQKELEDAARNLNNPDPQKREEARKKLDGAIGEQNRKELEKQADQLAEDLQSPDKDKRAAAEKKLDELKKRAAEQQAKNEEKGPGGKEKGSEPSAKKVEDKLDKLSPEQQREAARAADDLTNPDPQKQQDARDTLDKLVGPDARKAQEELAKQQKAEREKLKKDLKSPDQKTREAAEKKVEDARKRAEEEAKQRGGKRKLTDEEIRELTEKARDLDSPDEEKRRAAEQALDDKLGVEERRRIQELIRGFNRPEPPKPEETDPRHKARTAQLQLEEFEKNRYNRDLQEKLGWDQAKMDEFLESQRRRAEQLAKEADRAEEEERKPPADPPARPTLNAGGAGKVDALGTGIGKTTGAGAAVPPAGFDGARRKFEEELKRLQPKR